MAIPEFFYSYIAAILLFIALVYALYRLKKFMDRWGSYLPEDVLTDEQNFGYGEPDSTFVKQDLEEWGHNKDEFAGKRGRR